MKRRLFVCFLALTMLLEPDCLRSRQQNCGFQRQQPPCGYRLRDRGERVFRR